MLDENLPTFFFKPSRDKIKHDATLYLAERGADAVPAYTLRHADPASPEAQNRYAAGLYDAYSPEILYGEVLLTPEWTHSHAGGSTSANDEIRRHHDGVPPPPQPVLPRAFTVQLYNPDQQIEVRETTSGFTATQTWTFEMPQQTFRQPSGSVLDRTQHDPSVSEATPQVAFRWKRDGKLSKDLICQLSGKSRHPDGSKKKPKEPDIPLAFFRSLRELSVYEPNMTRIDMEDPKGFEVVLLLSAAVIRDVYFGSLRTAFNVSDLSVATATAIAAPSSSASAGAIVSKPSFLASSASLLGHPKPPTKPNASTSPLNQSTPPSSTSPQPPVTTASRPAANIRPPPTDPRTQWQIDAQTAQLQQQVDSEARARAKREAEDRRRAERLQADEAKAARKQQAAIDRETERLRKQYEAEQKKLQKAGKTPPSSGPRPPNTNPPLMHGALAPGPAMQRPHSAASSSHAGRHSTPTAAYGLSAYPSSTGHTGSYVGSHGGASVGGGGHFNTPNNRYGSHLAPSAPLLPPRPNSSTGFPASSHQYHHHASSGNGSGSGGGNGSSHSGLRSRLSTMFDLRDRSDDPMSNARDGGAMGVRGGDGSSALAKKRSALF